MSPTDLRMTVRQLRQDPAYSAVVVLGLAIAMAIALLLTAYVRQNSTSDDDLLAPDRLARVEVKYGGTGEGRKWTAAMMMPFKEAIERSGAPVQAVRFYTRDLSVRVGDQVLGLRMAFADQTLPAVLGIQPLTGDVSRALSQPDAVALSSRAAEKLFGRQSPLGKVVRVQGHTLQVVAVMPTRPANSHFQYDLLASLGSSAWANRQEAMDDWGHHAGRILVRLLPGADFGQVGRTLQAAFDASPRREQTSPDTFIDGHPGLIRLIPVPRLALDGADSEGNRVMLTGLLLLAGLIVLLAGINYVNLSTVRTLRRQREIGIRKVLGAAPGQIIVQFLLESCLVAVLATLFGMLLAWLVWPALAELMNVKLDTLLDAPMVVGALLFALLVGGLSGLYPAWLASQVAVAQALAGRDRQESRNGLWLRRGLTVVQFAAAVGLSALAVVVFLQTRFASRMDPGFDSHPLLVIDLAEGTPFSAQESIQRALRRIPGIAAVARSADAPGRAWTHVHRSLIQPGTGKNLNIQVEMVDTEFFITYGIQPLAGRVFDASRDQVVKDNPNVVLNQRALALLGFRSAAEAVGRHIQDGDGVDLVVVGVIPDIRHDSLREPAAAIVYRAVPELLGTLTLRVSGDRQAAKAAVHQLWRQYFPDEKPYVAWLDEIITGRYQTDLQMAKVLMVAGGIATLIAGYGLYALAAYSVRRREREIVIRKLYGAGRGQILLLMVREFGVLLLAGASLGLPLALFAIESYLVGFTARAPIGLWPVLVALLIAGLVALTATLRHTLQAMTLQPGRALQG